MSEETQICRGPCGLEKPLSEFYKDSSRPNGKTTRCKVCCAEASHVYYHSDLEAGRARNKRWNDAHRDLLREQDRQRYQDDPEGYRNRRLVWRFDKTIEEFEAELAEAGGCGICWMYESTGRDGQFHVDHDRNCCSGAKSCGKCVRGIICQRCNTYVIPVWEGKRTGDIDDLWMFVKAYMDDYADRRRALDLLEMEIESCV